MPTMVAIADLTGQPGSGPTLLEAVRNLRQVSIAEPGTRELVPAIAGTLRGLLAGVDVMVGILDVP